MASSSHHCVWAKLCRLSPVDAHAVALKPFMGKYLDIILDIVLWHFATCTSVNCLTCVLVMTLNCIHTELNYIE